MKHSVMIRWIHDSTGSVGVRGITMELGFQGTKSFFEVLDGLAKSSP